MKTSIIITFCFLCNVFALSQVSYPTDQGVYIYRTDDNTFEKLEKIKYKYNFYTVKNFDMLSILLGEDEGYAAVGSALEIYWIPSEEILSEKVKQFRKGLDRIYINEDEGMFDFGGQIRKVKINTNWYLSKIENRVDVNNMVNYLKDETTIRINEYVIGSPKFEYVHVGAGMFYNLDEGNYIKCTTKHIELWKKELGKISPENGFNAISTDPFENMNVDAFLYVINVVE